MNKLPKNTGSKFKRLFYTSQQRPVLLEDDGAFDYPNLKTDNCEGALPSEAKP